MTAAAAAVVAVAAAAAAAAVATAAVAAAKTIHLDKNYQKCWPLLGSICVSEVVILDQSAGLVLKLL